VYRGSAIRASRTCQCSQPKAGGAPENRWQTAFYQPFASSENSFDSRGHIITQFLSSLQCSLYPNNLQFSGGDLAGRFVVLMCGVQAALVTGEHPPHLWAGHKDAFPCRASCNLRRKQPTPLPSGSSGHRRRSARCTDRAPLERFDSRGHKVGQLQSRSYGPDPLLSVNPALSTGPPSLSAVGRLLSCGGWRRKRVGANISDIQIRYASLVAATGVNGIGMILRNFAHALREVRRGARQLSS
jgi:hypothetical protein